jgi:Family of unknown function (DUF5947)
MEKEWIERYLFLTMLKADQIRDMSQGFDTLRQFARKPRRPVEQCDMCSAELREDHQHLIELTHRRLHCACDACAVLFGASAGTKYRRVPRDIRLLANFQMTDAQWDALLIPINLAFFFRNSLDARVTALYPSPAGATESLLLLESWENIVEHNLSLSRMEPDVEALLVNRVRSARATSPPEYYIVPIDACYALVGLIRLHWRGLSGGAEVWREIDAFFARLRSKAQCITDGGHA